MKQTAVDMFCLSITDHIEGIFNGSIQQDEFAKRMRESYNQANKMFEEQIIDAHIIGDNTYTVGGAYLYNAAKQYFNETYKQQTP